MEIKCKCCGWKWNTIQSKENDKYLCHKCWFDNMAFYDKCIFPKQVNKPFN